MRKVAFVNPEGRAQALITHQRQKMATSAHAYVRGSTRRFYEWLGASGQPQIPKGPGVWICGDCHVGNLGPIAAKNGSIAIQIRDLDQTVIGNPAHDIIRLGLSLSTAARSSDLPGVITARMIERVVAGYEMAFNSDVNAVELDRPEVVARILRRASGRSWRHLADERIVGEKRYIPLGSRFWPLDDRERKAISELFDRNEIKKLVATLRSQVDDTPVTVLDAAYWRKGCSSLGLLRVAVLVQLGSGRSKRHCLLDVKEAVKASAPHFFSTEMPSDEAERVVAGARMLSPYLGQRMMAARLLGKSVFIRELLPQDLKLEIEHLSQDEAVVTAEYLAYIVGKSHARQMDNSERTEWLAELSKGRSQSLEAPSWLWNSVVDLAAAHEAAYLQHCRKHALA